VEAKVTTEAGKEVAIAGEVRRKWEMGRPPFPRDDRVEITKVSAIAGEVRRKGDGKTPFPQG